MGKIYYMMGKSSSGKDTLFKEVKQAMPELKTITLYTTRPIREGEHNGVEYYFVSEDTLNAYESQGKIIEMRAYHTVHGIWKYATIDDGRLKKNETVCYEDGKTEEYESGFHNLYPLYLTKEGDVYADYCGSDIGDSIPMEQLTYLGKGSVFNSKSPTETIEFRKDTVGFI